jgi:hypothetical protein
MPILLKATRWTWRIIFYVFLVPLTVHAALWTSQGWPASWRTADWSSAGILPEASASPPATIRVYAARTGGWKGIFATHSWIVVKPRNAGTYQRYDVVGWGTPVRNNSFPPDGRWYGNDPVLVKAIDGQEAERLIPQVQEAIAAYKWSSRGDYHVWPGPNSNTFVASVLEAVPELGITLPSTAIGKDFPADGRWFGTTAGGGWRLSASGYAGVTIGPADGLEINLLGLVAGIDLAPLAVKLPGFGEVGQFEIWAH